MNGGKLKLHRIAEKLSAVSPTTIQCKTRLKQYFPTKIDGKDIPEDIKTLCFQFYYLENVDQIVDGWLRIG